jgi:hypothetical protein
MGVPSGDIKVLQYHVSRISPLSSSRVVTSGQQTGRDGDANRRIFCNVWLTHQTRDILIVLNLS